MRAPHMNKKKVGVIGAGGRMGQEIGQLLQNHHSLEPFFGLDPNAAPGFWNHGFTLADREADQVHVWIDFSTSEAFEQNLKKAVQRQTPFICGTTGLSAKNHASLKKAAQKIPILWASNMSLGVAVLNEALKAFSLIQEFDYQVEEVHHNRKKDKPSGTALTIQQNLEHAVGRPLPEPLAIRGGGVYGIHKVWALSEEEVLVFEHSALNRTVFARGAVRAAHWILNKKPGLYAIRDVLLETKPAKKGGRK